MAERVGFEPTWGDKAPNRFRIGAVMTTSVPLLRTVCALRLPSDSARIFTVARIVSAKPLARRN